MEIEQFREFCLSFDQTAEGMPFNVFSETRKQSLPVDIS